MNFTSRFMYMVAYGKPQGSRTGTTDRRTAAIWGNREDPQVDHFCCLSHLQKLQISGECQHSWLCDLPQISISCFSFAAPDVRMYHPWFLVGGFWDAHLTPKATSYFSTTRNHSQDSRPWFSTTPTTPKSICSRILADVIFGNMLIDDTPYFTIHK